MLLDEHAAARTAATYAALSLRFRIDGPPGRVRAFARLYAACAVESDACADTLVSIGTDEDEQRALLQAAGTVDASCVRASKDDFVVLHAALVACPTGSVLLTGPSGAGKSSLSAGLAARGCAYGGDEAIGLRLGNNELVAYPKPWKLDAAARAALARLGAPTCISPEPSELLVAPSEVGPHLTLGAADAPVLVVRVEFRPGARTVTTPISRPAVAELLATQCFNFAHLGASALDAVADVARRAPGVHMVFGDLGDAAETIERVAA